MQMDHTRDLWQKFYGKKIEWALGEPKTYTFLLWNYFVSILTGF